MCIRPPARNRKAHTGRHDITECLEIDCEVFEKALDERTPDQGNVLRFIANGSGFGAAHDEVYWLGLERMLHFTNTDNTLLKVEVRIGIASICFYAITGSSSINRKGFRNDAFR